MCGWKIISLTDVNTVQGSFRFLVQMLGALALFLWKCVFCCSVFVKVNVSPRGRGTTKVAVKVVESV